MHRNERDGAQSTHAGAFAAQSPFGVPASGRLPTQAGVVNMHSANRRYPTMRLDELDAGEFRVCAAAIDGPAGYAAAAVCRAMTILLAFTLTACGGLEGPVAGAVVESIVKEDLNGGWSSSSGTPPTSYPNLCPVMQPCGANPSLQCEVWVPCETQDRNAGEGTPPPPGSTDAVASPS
jgi:hypothetical protein